MMIKWRYLHNQDGLTLVEVLGSIVILSIIVVTFLAFFIQSARMTEVSGEISSGSYVAQQQVEELYHQSHEYDYNRLIAHLIEASDHYQSTGGSEVFTLSKEGFIMTIELLPAKNSLEQTIDNLYTLIVKTYDQDDKLQAQLETKFFLDKVGDNND